MKTIKTTFASTILAAALGLALGLAPTSAEAKPKCDDPPCGDGGDSGFTAELTGAFVFGPVAVTPNSRESVLRSEYDLNFDIDFSLQPDTWDDVFAHCLELLDLYSVDDFFVGEDDWRIAKAGGVRVIFNNIQLPSAEITVQLIGEEFDFSGDPFLPEAENTRVFILTKGSIWGDSLKGEPGPRRSCKSGEFDLMDYSTLEITAVAAP